MPSDKHMLGRDRPQQGRHKHWKGGHRQLGALGKSKLLDRPPNPHALNPKQKRMMHQFELSLGGREAVLEALDASDHPKIQQLAAMMADPKFARYNLARLCGMVQISVGQFLMQFQKAEGARAFTQAMHEIHAKLPEIAKDIAYRALPFLQQCPKCNGTRHARDPQTNKLLPEPCPTCEGLGKVEVVPEIERVKLAAQVGSLVKGGGAQVAVQVNQNVNVGADAAGSSPQFREAIGKLLYPGKARSSGTTDGTETAAGPESEPLEAELTGRS